MSKIKTHRGAAKRFRRSGSGFKYRPANKNHILTKKTPKRKRHLRAYRQVSDDNLRSVSRMVPKRAQGTVENARPSDAQQERRCRESSEE